LTSKLKKQLIKLNFIINYINCNLRIKNENKSEWKLVIEKIMDLCLEISNIVNPIVKSDSPEGIFPSELSSNFS
jgi:hypothetical protein